MRKYYRFIINTVLTLTFVAIVPFIALTFPLTNVCHINVGDSFILTTDWENISSNSTICDIAECDGGYQITGNQEGYFEFQIKKFIFTKNISVIVENPSITSDFICNVGTTTLITVNGTATNPSWFYSDLDGITHTEVSPTTLELTIPDTAKTGNYFVSVNVNNQAFTSNFTVESPILAKNANSVAAYDEIIISAIDTNSPVIWNCNSTDIILEKCGAMCVVTSSVPGDYVINATVNNSSFDIPVTFTPHQHTQGEWETVFENTCEENGLREAKCSICEEVLNTEVLPAIGHDEGTWITVQEMSLFEPKITAKKCNICNKTLATEKITYQEYVCNEIGKRGNKGRLNIPSVGVDVAVFTVYYDNIEHAQRVIDNKDSAAWYNFGDRALIGDHNTQGFEAMKSCKIGDAAYFVSSSGTEVYYCIEKGIGKNTGVDVIDSNCKSLIFNNKGRIVMYTCNKGGGITYTIWE